MVLGRIVHRFRKLSHRIQMNMIYTIYGCNILSGQSSLRNGFFQTPQLWLLRIGPAVTVTISCTPSAVAFHTGFSLTFIYPLDINHGVLENPWPLTCFCPMMDRSMKLVRPGKPIISQYLEWLCTIGPYLWRLNGLVANIPKVIELNYHSHTIVIATVINKELEK